MTDPIIRRRENTLESHFSADVHPFLQTLFIKRGLNRDAQIQQGLNQLADPFLFKDMQRAVERLYQALIASEKIIIVGDFDADGATSSALALLVLQKMGFPHVNFIVPNRFEYGYGLSEEIVEELRWQNPDLIITVDNGISSVGGVEKANALGMDVIITDHHLPGSLLPAACAIVNPNQRGCLFPSKALAGVGVVFHLLIALRKTLREKNWFKNHEIAEPNLADYLDLVALGTIADVVPMDFYNRILVAQGLARMRSGKMRPGMAQLLNVSAKDYRYVSSADLGFAVAPRLNAAGRLDDMTQGIMLLLTESESLAHELAQTLDEFNRERRVIEQKMQQEAFVIVDRLTANLETIPRGFCLYHPDWHQGVVGLIASRLKEKFHRPVIAFAQVEGSERRELKGSGRSIKGIHLRDLLDGIATSHPAMLEKFGGHAMAAGLSLSADYLDAFRQAFEQSLDRIDDAGLFDSILESDGDIAESDMNVFTAQLLRDAMPWGQQFPEPLFDGVFYVQKARVMAEKHLKLTVSFGKNSQATFDAVFFNCDVDFWQHQQKVPVRMVYRLAINYFRGNQTLQLIVEHMNLLP